MEYPLMSVNDTAKWVPIMEKFSVSIQARSQGGFLTNYLKNGSSMLKKTSDEKHLTWDAKRKLFLKRTIPAFEKKPSMRRYLSLIAWAYKPDVKDADLLLK